MAKKNADDEPETCVWCRPGSAALKPDADRQREEADPNHMPHDATTAKKSNDDEPEMTWINCTRCKTWYHADCVALQELVSKVGVEEGDVPDPFTTPGSSGSLPPEVIKLLRTNGMSWDWTGCVDKWYVPTHIASTSPANGRLIRHHFLISYRYCTPCITKAFEAKARLPRSTIKKGYSFPSAQSPVPLDAPQQDTAQPQSARSSKAGKEKEDPSRPKRKATLQRPDYHALHNNISTPTAKWLALIRDPGKSGRKIREGEFRESMTNSCANQAYTFPFQRITPEWTDPSFGNHGSTEHTIPNNPLKSRRKPSSAPIGNPSLFRVRGAVSSR